MPKLSFWAKFLLFYGTRLPNHPRKWWLHDRLRRFLRVNVDGNEQVIRGGLQWSLNPADFQHTELYWLGSFDTWDLYHIRRLLKPGSVLLDIGSNFGYYSLTLAKQLGSCRVHAFEPSPSTFSRLQDNIRANLLEGTVQAHQMALSDVIGTGTLVFRPDNSGATHLAADASGDVRLDTLDHFFEREGLTGVDFIKIDVEGFEDRVLLGGCQTLVRFKPLLCVELWPHGMEREGSSVAAVVEILKDLHYSLWVPHRGRLEPLLSLPTGEDAPLNVLCLHMDSATKVY